MDYVGLDGGHQIPNPARKRNEQNTTGRERIHERSKYAKFVYIVIELI